MTASLNLFGGLFTVPMWGYFWGFTAAQIELAMLDAPMIVYDKERRGQRKKGKKGAIEFEKAKGADVRAAAAAWQEKHTDGAGTKINLSGLKALSDGRI